ncbi:MAG: DUF4421 family protein [Flavobacteriales bacterium]|nr:DUF4421 family protein [Flavobacteriales bacterium]
MRLVFLSTAFVFAFATAQAQLGDRIRHFLVGDTAAPPDHDTAYIATYNQDLTISLLSSYRLASLDITDTSGHSVTYTTNNAVQYGAGITYKWLSVDGTISIPALDAADPAFGKTRSRSIGAGLTARRLWIRAFWNKTSGYYPEQPAAVSQGWKEGAPIPVRPDLTTETVMASVNYALSKKRRFSQNAALWQMERQSRSAGTWVLGGAFWFTDLRADSSVVPVRDSVAFSPVARIDRAKRVLLGATVGYTHTFVFWRTGFIHFSLLAGAASRDQRLRTASDGAWVSSNGISSLSEFKLGAGYNGDRWYTALTTAFFLNSDGEEESVRLGSTYGTVRFAVGVRFGKPNIRGMEKVGL